jgi:hypothetical protein
VFDPKHRLNHLAGLVGGLTVFGLVGTASAQVEQVSPQSDVMEIATDDPSQEIAYYDEPHHRYGGYRRSTAFGLRAGGGFASTKGVADGWYGRLEATIYTDGSQAMAIGAEGWGAEDAGGASMPLYSGFKLDAGPLFISLGIGFDIFLIDKVHGDTGWGLFAPFAGAYAGLDFDGFKVLADGRGRYRWQFGAEDRGQATLGLALELTL